MLRNIYQKTVTHRNRTTKPKNEMVKDYTNQNQRSEATELKKGRVQGRSPGAFRPDFPRKVRENPYGAGRPDFKVEEVTSKNGKPLEGPRPSAYPKLAAFFVIEGCMTPDFVLQ
jgi:hypothetical protein